MKKANTIEIHFTNGEVGRYECKKPPDITSNQRIVIMDLSDNTKMIIPLRQILTVIII